MGGTNLELAKAIVAAAGKDCRVTIAGGVTTAEEIRALDEIGADAQVGMALYTGRLDLADAIMAPLVTDRPDGLYPTVVVDERGVCLGLVYSSKESIREAVRRRMGIYQSRSPRPVGQGRDQRRHAGAAADRPRLRPRQPALRRPPVRPRLLPPRHPHLLGRGRGPRSSRAHAGRAPRAGAARELHRQAVRRPGAARRQAARGGGRARRGARPRARDLGGRRRALLHARPSRRRGHRPGRGRGASRPAGAEGDAAGVAGGCARGRPAIY